MALSPPVPYASLCSGSGGLDLGVKLAFPQARCILYVEREISAVKELVAGMEEGRLDAAPVWSDLATLGGREWRGHLQMVVGGIPCQPASCAGKRKGTEDERWLWDHALRFAEEAEVPIVFWENVPGLTQNTLLPAFRDRILGRMEALGYEVACGFFSAAEVGAPHKRERLFILGVRRGWLANSDGVGRWRQGDSCDQEGIEPQGKGGVVGNTGFQGLEAGRRLAGDNGTECSASQRTGLPYWPPGPSDRAAWQRALQTHLWLAPALSVNDLWQIALGEVVREFGSLRQGDVRLSQRLKKAVKQRFRALAHGLADGRLDALRGLGNAVVPVVAAYAFRHLWQSLFGRDADPAAAFFVSATNPVGVR